MRPGEMAVRALLMRHRMNGRELRHAIGWSSAAAFYHLMAEIENSGDIVHETVIQVINGIETTERIYSFNPG